MTAKKILTLVSFLILSGCAYHGAIPKGYNGPVVIVWDKVDKISSLNAHYFELLSVDGRLTNKTSLFTRKKSFETGFAMNLIPLSRNIPVNSRKLIIGGFNYQVVDLFGLGDFIYRVVGEINVHLEAGKSYQINGELSKDYSLVWVEDEKTGIIVSQILIKGEVPLGYIEKLKSQKLVLYQKKLIAHKIKKKQARERLNKAVAFSEDGRCDAENYPLQNITELYQVAKTLFHNKKYKQSLKCFEKISEIPTVPKETYKYLFLLYDVGLGVEEDQQKAQFWKTKFDTDND